MWCTGTGKGARKARRTSRNAYLAACLEEDRAHYRHRPTPRPATTAGEFFSLPGAHIHGCPVRIHWLRRRGGWGLEGNWGGGGNAH